MTLGLDFFNFDGIVVCSMFVFVFYEFSKLAIELPYATYEESKIFIFLNFSFA